MSNPTSQFITNWTKGRASSCLSLATSGILISSTTLKAQEGLLPTSLALPRVHEAQGSREHWEEAFEGWLSAFEAWCPVTPSPSSCMSGPPASLRSWCWALQQPWEWKGKRGTEDPEIWWQGCRSAHIKEAAPALQHDGSPVSQRLDHIQSLALRPDTQTEPWKTIPSWEQLPIFQKGWTHQALGFLL